MQNGFNSVYISNMNAYKLGENLLVIGAAGSVIGLGLVVTGYCLQKGSLKKNFIFDSELVLKTVLDTIVPKILK